MAAIKVSTENVLEPYAMPADSECELRIIDVKEDKNVNGLPYIMPRFEVNDEIAAKEFGYYIGIPHDSMTEKQANAAAYKYINFCVAFGIDPAVENEPEDFIGLEGVAILGMEESSEYGEQNFIKRFVAEA